MTSTVFPRHVRLLTAGDYRRVFDQADAKAQSKQILILARRNELGIARMGLVVAKKHAKRAVDRNEIKRIIRESFRHHQFELENFDCVVLSRAGAKDLDKTELRHMVDQLWTRLRQKPNGNRSRKKTRQQ
ncbi:ribonuclease P protein component [Oceaniserpentilla sp. 4NH20-0058]|uniref:ribonuclease P protein component n=1 Tax=Oceaniserpentilla sp. 4NH20-0058 TaxID=3127660 RepID=UPI00310448F6